MLDRACAAKVVISGHVFKTEVIKAISVGKDSL